MIAFPAAHTSFTVRSPTPPMISLRAPPVINPNPWHALASDWPKVPIFIRVLPDKWGQTIWEGDRASIELAHDLGPVQQRCTLAHELHHLEAGKPCSSFCGINERDVVEATARWLLPDLAVIGRALASADMARAADRLDVTVTVLNDRLVCLSEMEQRKLATLIKQGSEGGGTRAANEARRSTSRPPHRCKVVTASG